MLMKRNSFDILVPKEYETIADGKVTKRKSWNRVGRAWQGNSDRTMSFELFLLPGQQYVIALRGKDEVVTPTEESANFDEISL